MGRKRRRPQNLLAATLEAQVAMWVTLGVRVPQLLAGTMTPAERHRMVAEKAAATAESVQAATRALAGMAGKPSRLRSPRRAMGSLAAFADAVAAPFQVRVKANAKRLTKPRARSR